MRTTVLAVALACAALFHTPVTTAAPPKAALVAGFSTERLQRLDTVINDEISRRQLAGGVMVVLRDGKPVVFKAYGQQDIEAGKPMRTDTIFRIASMTKALTSVAVMMLYEEGRFQLKDPVAKFLPAFANLQVALAQGGTEKARRAVTIHDLLTHTAGMSYGAGPAKAAYEAAGMKDWYLVGHDETLAQWTDRLAALPLQGQPGEAFTYGYATDVLGRLVEVVSGQPLGQVWPFLLGTVIFGSIGVGMFFFAWRSGRRRALIDVVGTDLLVTEQSTGRAKSQSWTRDEIARVVVGKSGMEVNDVPVMELQVWPVNGKKVGLFRERDDAELRWMAAEIRAALGPAT